MKTAQEGVSVIKNDNDELIGIIRKDEATRKNVMYSISEMSIDEMEAIIKNEDKKIVHENI